MPNIPEPRRKVMVLETEYPRLNLYLPLQLKDTFKYFFLSASNVLLKSAPTCRNQSMWFQLAYLVYSNKNRKLPRGATVKWFRGFVDIFATKKSPRGIFAIFVVFRHTSCFIYLLCKL